MLKPFASKADEGMWLLSLLGNMNYDEMRKKGLKLTPEQLYSINQSSLKDAIAGLNMQNPQRNFCTSEVISSEGLLLTNHHCAYGMIQSHSTTQNDYLTDGFWAASKDKELPNAGIAASFLVRMENVTNKIYGQLVGLTGEARTEKMKQLMAQVGAEAKNGTHYDCFVKDFLDGNEFYLFVMETFPDVRLVGTPPESIGKFGGDTDNWMWPRHTGDFSLLRVYAGKDGKPAQYSADNVPHRPKHVLPISISGVKEGDFTMVMGFPGRTQRYKTSEGLKIDYELKNPSFVKIRGEKLGIWKKDMDAAADIRIKYASKYASTSNYHKYYIGQNKGLKRLGTIGLKAQEEADFQKWADASGKDQYKTALSKINAAYLELAKYEQSLTFLQEAGLGVEIIAFANAFDMLKKALEEKEVNQEKVKKITDALKGAADAHFKDYNAPTDQKLFASLFKMYNEDIKVAEQKPTVFADVKGKYKGSFEAYAAFVFSKSMFTSKKAVEAFLAKPDMKVLKADPAFIAAVSVMELFKATNDKVLAPRMAVAEGMNNFVAGLREMQQSRRFYPDANSSIRLTYGSVRAYEPLNGVVYNHFTTIEGIIEKEDPNEREFNVPKRLIELYNNRDYGIYGEKGSLVTCFITDNDITGGNSGSPVINAKGELIGLAFDGNWESMTGDLVYDPAFKRCINMDIRYVLFIIDKYAGATHLVKEMNLVR